MSVLTQPPKMGDVLKYELNPNFTRETVTLLAGTNYPVGAVLGRITASGKMKLSIAAGSDGAQTAAAILLYDVDATAADATGIVVLRGPARCALHACTGRCQVQPGHDRKIRRYVYTRETKESCSHRRHAQAPRTRKRACQSRAKMDPKTGLIKTDTLTVELQARWPVCDRISKRRQPNAKPAGDHSNGAR